jgi:hypothetical protein
VASGVCANPQETDVRRPIPTALTGLALAGLLLPALAGPAAAHEGKEVGEYHFTVGFGTEPAYAGAPNSVQLILADHHDKPVTDLGDSLKVAVSTGDSQPMQLLLEPFFEVGEFGTPGDYRGFFIPTAPGKYTFHFTGSVKGQKIDQRFSSGPKTFAEIQDPAEVQYPVKEPTASQLTTRLDRESARTRAALAASGSDARDQAASARALALVGLAVGAAGLLAAVAVGVLSLRKRA